MTERDTAQDQKTQGNNVNPQPILPGQRHATSQSMKDEAPCYRVYQSYLQVHRKAALMLSNINHNTSSTRRPRTTFRGRDWQPQDHISWLRCTATPRGEAGMRMGSRSMQTSYQNVMPTLVRSPLLSICRNSTKPNRDCIQETT